MCTNFLLYVALVILTMLLQKIYFPESLPSEDDAEDSSVRVVQVGKITATFRLPERAEEKPKEMAKAAGWMW